MPPVKFSRAEAQAHLSTLQRLLDDIGPAISKSLTHLVVNAPGATKTDALAFLAAELLVVSTGRLRVNGTASTHLEVPNLWLKFDRRPRSRPAGSRMALSSTVGPWRWAGHSGGLSGWIVAATSASSKKGARDVSSKLPGYGTSLCRRRTQGVDGLVYLAAERTFSSLKLEDSSAFGLPPRSHRAPEQERSHQSSTSGYAREAAGELSTAANSPAPESGRGLGTDDQTLLVDRVATEQSEAPADSPDSYRQPLKEDSVGSQAATNGSAALPDGLLADEPVPEGEGTGDSEPWEAEAELAPTTEACSRVHTARTAATARSRQRTASQEAAEAAPKSVAGSRVHTARTAATARSRQRTASQEGAALASDATAAAWPDAASEQGSPALPDALSPVADSVAPAEGEPSPEPAAAASAYDFSPTAVPGAQLDYSPSEADALSPSVPAAAGGYGLLDLPSAGGYGLLDLPSVGGDEALGQEEADDLGQEQALGHLPCAHPEAAQGEAAEEEEKEQEQEEGDGGYGYSPAQLPSIAESGGGDEGYSPLVPGGDEEAPQPEEGSAADSPEKKNSDEYKLPERVNVAM